MAKRDLILNEQERGGLKRAEDSTHTARELKRLQAVRMYGEGKPVSEIQDLVGCSRRMLMYWVKQYKAEGPEGLVEHRLGGNSAKLSRLQKQEICQRVNQYRPDQILPAEMRISQGEFWTTSDLKIAVQSWYGVSYQSPTSYLNLFQECGFSQHKPEKRYRSRPSEEEVAEFDARLEKK